MSNRIVKYARFQTPMHHPACGSFGDVLPSLSKTYKDLTMHESTYGLEVTINGLTIVIPWANVKGYEATDDANAKPLDLRKHLA